MALATRPSPGSRAAFTLIEALVALSLTALAGAAILLTIETSLDAADHALEQTIASGMADQLLDEAAGALYAEPEVGPYQVSPGPNNWETAGAGRERFNDSDDYHGFVAQPPEDPWGQPLGSEDDEGGLRPESFRAPEGSFDRFRQRVKVFYVSPNDLSARLPAGQTSDYRAVEVEISLELSDGQYRVLIQRRRNLSYLPSAP